jgi:hypothetical protein
MTTQVEHKGHGLANNVPLQFAIVTIAAVLLIVLAARYVW